MGNVKIRYSVRDSKTGYFTKYRTLTVKDVDIPTNKWGAILFGTLCKQCEEKAKALITEPFRMLSYQLIEQIEQ